MTIVELSDDKTEVLKAMAARRGLTLQNWMEQMADSSIDSEADSSDPYPL